MPLSNYINFLKDLSKRVSTEKDRYGSNYTEYKESKENKRTKRINRKIKKRVKNKRTKRKHKRKHNAKLQKNKTTQQDKIEHTLLVEHIVSKKAMYSASNDKFAYTEEQYEEYEQLIKQYITKSDEQIAEILIINGQSILGQRQALVERIADGEIKGAIPRCPLCMGYLIYEYRTDVYKCIGSMGGTMKCKFEGHSSDVVRIPWVVPPSFYLECS